MVAAEFNLSETAFVWDNPAPADGYIIRFFTPTIEMDLCGHATLAASAAAFLYFSPPDITSTSFHAPAGVLGTSLVHREDGTATIAMNLPWTDVSDDLPADAPLRRGILTAARTSLGLGLDDVLNVRLAHDGSDVLLEVSNAAFDAIDVGTVADLASVPGYTRGVVVCCRGTDDGGPHFRSRFFAPKSGIPEDPVTGSAHCMLAPYFGDILGKDEMKAQQDSSRGGELVCTLDRKQRSVGVRGVAAVRAAGRLLGP